MILCTVGTHQQPFDRLVIAMDQYAAGISERVIIQRGTTTYVPVNASHFKFTSYENLMSLYNQSRIIVSHAAAGAIITAINFKKPLIVVPRSTKYEEVIDDHQYQLAGALLRSGKAVAVYRLDQKELNKALLTVSRKVLQSNKSDQLVQSLGQVFNKSARSR